MLNVTFLMMAVVWGALAPHAQAGFCGPESPQGYQLTPRHGIAVERNGFTEAHPQAACRIKLDYIDQAVDVQIARWGTQGISAAQVVQELRKAKIILRSDDGWYQTGVSWNGSGTLTSATSHISVTSNDGTPALCYSGDNSSKVLIHEWDHVLAYVFRRSVWRDVGPGHLGAGIGYNIDGSVMAPYSPQPAYQNYCVDPVQPEAASWSVDVWGMSGDVPLKGKFYGSAKDDLAIYRSGANQSFWWIKQTGGNQHRAIPWGIAGDVPHVGRFLPGTRSQLAVFRPSNGTWYAIDPMDLRISVLQWGQAGDVSFVGNFQNLGTDDVAVFRPSTGVIYIRNLQQPDRVKYLYWGIQGDQPLAGDFLGRGYDQIAQYRSSNSHWYILDPILLTMHSQKWGIATDIPVPGKFLSNGRTQIAIFRPGAQSVFWIRDIVSGEMKILPWGVSTDLPIALDYDGSGREQCAIFRPTGGQWWIWKDL